MEGNTHSTFTGIALKCERTDVRNSISWNFIVNSFTHDHSNGKIGIY